MTTLSELKLSPSEVSALVVLMSEARPIYNADLESQYRIRLNLSQSKLVKDGLIRVFKAGEPGKRGNSVELTDVGWRRTRELLRVGSIGGSGPTPYALASLLSAVDRGLQTHRLSPADFFYREEVAETAELASDLEQAIRLAYKGLATKPGDWVRFPAIRAAVAPAGKTDVDAALARLAVQPDVRIIPVANRTSLSSEDKAAAVKLGGEMKHAIAIEG